MLSEKLYFICLGAKILGISKMADDINLFERRRVDEGYKPLSSEVDGARGIHTISMRVVWRSSLQSKPFNSC